MTDMTAALRIFAETQSAETGLKRMGESLRQMGVDGRKAGTEGAVGAETATKGWRGAADTVQAGSERGGKALDVFSSALQRNSGQVSGAAGNVQRLISGIGAMPAPMMVAAAAGTALGAALTIAFGKGLAAYQALETQLLTTTAVIRATGGSAGRSWEDINRLAIDLGRNTLASTVGVRAAATQLLTFRSIAGETFDRTMRVAQDLSANGFGSIESAALQLGKALEDPEQGLSALTRVGVSFSGAQKELIKDLMATGQVAQAQAVILGQIEAQVGGSGVAAGSGLAGAFDTLTENIGLLFETIGGGTAKLTALQALLKDVANGVAGLTDALTPSDPDQTRLSELRRQMDDRLRLLHMDNDRAEWSPFKMSASARTELLSEINSLNDEVLAITRRRLAAEEELATKSAAEQDKIAAERVDGVLRALEAEAAAAGKTKIELEALKRAREAGVDPALPANVEQYEQILALVRQIAATRVDAEWQGRLAALQQEAELQELIARYGAESVEVARFRTEQERAALIAQMEAVGVAADLQRELMAAFDAAKGLAGTDMASGIAAARAEARAMADEITRALGAAQALAAQSSGSLEDAQLRWKYRDDPVALAGALANTRFDRQVKLPSGAEDRTVARVERQRAIDVGNAREEAVVKQRLAEWQQAQNKLKHGAGGAGAGAKDTLAGLSKEAMELLSGLDIAAAAISEKVKAGLISVAEGEKEMAGAKERAAGQLAELIARLDQLGPAGKAAADAARGALKDLANQAGKTNEDIRNGMIKSFEDSFVRSLATGKDAMSSFADHVQMELARAFTQKFITPMVTPLINCLMGMFGIFSAQGNVIGPSGVIPYAKGGVPSLPELGSYSNSIVDSPTAFGIGDDGVGIMGEAGAEAIIPLLTGARGPGVRAIGPDGVASVLPLQRAADGALGVQLPDVTEILRRPTFFAQGGVIGRLSDPPRLGETPSGSGYERRPSVVIHNNHSGARVEATERETSDGWSMEVMIEQLETALADRARRGVGSFSGVLGDQFGLSRVGR